MMRGKRKLFWMVPLGIVGMAAFLFIGGEIVKLLWNWLLPVLFGLNTISFWQALGLLALCRILFGGFGSSRSYGGRGMRRRMMERMEERVAGMTPEEREEFRRRMRDRWGCGPEASGGSPAPQGH